MRGGDGRAKLSNSYDRYVFSSYIERLISELNIDSWNQSTVQLFLFLSSSDDMYPNYYTGVPLDSKSQGSFQLNYTPNFKKISTLQLKSWESFEKKMLGSKPVLPGQMELSYSSSICVFLCFTAHCYNTDYITTPV